VVAPATANFIGKAANGIADDLLTTIALAVDCPVVIAPAMNSKMWSHPAVSANLDILLSRGVKIVQPEEGELACGDEGPGRLADLASIVKAAVDSLSKGDLEGIRVLVTAGPTREAVDPVRFLSNRSTGRMGYSIARAAAARGAAVTLISGPVDLDPPMVESIVNVTTGEEMLKEVKKALDESQWLIMAAAVADYRPSEPADGKIKKEGRDSMNLVLSRNPDILMEVSVLKAGRLFVGFAAETSDLVESAMTKIRQKNLDLIVANDVSGKETGFASHDNAATILDTEGNQEDLPKMPKSVMAERILDRALEAWKKK
jgi:phosphopantothenoylcysteine decarboxylase/phosphopantothenate--cysteine ligase